MRTSSPCNPNPNALSLLRPLLSVRRLPDPALGLWRRRSSPCSAAASSPALRAWLPPLLLRCSWSCARPVLSVRCAGARLPRSLLENSSAPSVPPRELRCSLPAPSSRRGTLRYSLGPSSRTLMLPQSLPAPSSRRGALWYSLLHSSGARCSHLLAPSYRRGALRYSLLHSSGARCSHLPAPSHRHTTVLPPPELRCSQVPHPWSILPARPGTSGAPSSTVCL
jgi:hypothetical protein